MADWAYNPVHGWAPGPFDALNCEYPYLSQDSSAQFSQAPHAYGQAVNGFFPAPPGLQWVDVGGGGIPLMMSNCACGGGNYGGGCSGGACGMIGGMPFMSGGLGGLPGMAAHPGQIQLCPNHAPEDGGTPGINLTNGTGGIGLEPGYNYIFPDAHIYIHVLKTSCPPWQLEGTEQIEYQAHKVPTCVSVGTMMKQFGCDNGDKGKNVLYEVVMGGGGKWYRGISIKGDDKRTEKSVGDMGWSAEEVTWLYFTKD